MIAPEDLSSSPTVAPPGSAQPKLIVIIDDDDAVRRWMGQALRLSGYRTHEAADGEDVVGLVSRLQPACVVLDLAMPGKDGLEALSELREHPHSSRVVAVTGMDWAGALLQAARLLGANAVLNKPFELKALLHAISPA
jgi:CheY-like chemotaxis protein